MKTKAQIPSFGEVMAEGDVSSASVGIPVACIIITCFNFSSNRQWTASADHFSLLTRYWSNEGKVLPLLITFYNSEGDRLPRLVLELKRNFPRRLRQVIIASYFVNETVIKRLVFYMESSNKKCNFWRLSVPIRQKLIFIQNGSAESGNAWVYTLQCVFKRWVSHVLCHSRPAPVTYPRSL